MADHNKNYQEKKSRSRWLIPAIIALVLGFVIVQLLLLDETRDQLATYETEEISEEMTAESQAELTNEPFHSIDEYIEFVSQNTPEDHVIFVDQYIASALDHLTDALQALSEQQNISINTKSFAQLKEQSDRIAGSKEQEKAMLVKNSFIMVLETLESINIESSESLQTEIFTLKEMVNTVDGKGAIEAQDEAVSKFLEQTGIVLELIEAEA